MNTADLPHFEQRMHQSIPLSKAMGVSVKNVSGTHVKLAAPLALNVNHKNTAFGGSVYSVAVLSCWVLVTKALEDWELNVDYVVVQDGHVDYTYPVGQDFEAESSWMSERESEKFHSALAKKGVARATLRAVVRSQGRECATVEARFAARTVIAAREGVKADTPKTSKGKTGEPGPRP